MIGGVGGALGWDGAILLHAEHLARKSEIAGVIPGQNMEDSAREHICDTL